MPDPWERWDKRVKASGQPDRVATELTDTELLVLLSTFDADRRAEKRILCDEALARLRRAPAEPRGPPPGDFELATWPPEARQGGFG